MHTSDNFTYKPKSSLQHCNGYLYLPLNGCLYLPLAYPPYFLASGTMKLLPDCELHLSIHVRLRAPNDTRYTSFINYSLLHYQ